MSKIVRALCLLVGVFLAGPVFAEDIGTADEASALVKKAIAHYKSVGKEKAFADFAAADGGFQVKDLYIFVQDLNGLMLAHPKNPGLNTKDLSNLKDADGKLFVAEMKEIAAGKGSGWVDYKWVNPATKKIQAKSSYIEAVDGMFFGAGIYK